MIIHTGLKIMKTIITFGEARTGKTKNLADKLIHLINQEKDLDILVLNTGIGGILSILSRKFDCVYFNKTIQTIKVKNTKIMFKSFDINKILGYSLNYIFVDDYHLIKQDNENLFRLHCRLRKEPAELYIYSELTVSLIDFFLSNKNVELKQYE